MVESCDDCHALAAPLPAGVNPRGLRALELWQTDVTQVAKFGRFKYVHVTFDTFFSAMWASAHMGEKTHNVIVHWRQAFAVLGIPSPVKANNGPAYASQKILGYAGYLQSVFILTCDHKGRIWLMGKLETMTKMKVIKWMNHPLDDSDADNASVHSDGPSASRHNIVHFSFFLFFFNGKRAIVVSVLSHLKSRCGLPFVAKGNKDMDLLVHAKGITLL
ncbi:hypothetical protein HGM15179_020426 [Zosterops borbonicus]|uniref:Integrase catalytic domain-containing protein n=1 Tax=Zosterops borbonicus TaxID=364589 RepID=A0A8K1FU64_9PASS|nr:hypothetical protein HGM15179_020426 [Zosterops borbonicus]